jgi:hypothetical protein
MLMSFVAKLLTVLGTVRRLFTGASVETNPTVIDAAAFILPRAPAVAGYVRRLAADRFFLASRLASVARLNTPQGRKPQTARRATVKPPIPCDRIGAKKVRTGTSQGLRVLPMIEARRRSAEIIPFPQSRLATSQTAPRLQKAA